MKKVLKKFLIYLGLLIMIASLVMIVGVLYSYFFVTAGCPVGVHGLEITNSVVPCGWKPPLGVFLKRQAILLAPLILSFLLYKLGKKINA
jgi:ABC-type Na+ efflux pump permease subunit